MRIYNPQPVLAVAHNGGAEFTTELVLSENGYILFDDTVLDKSHSFAIEVVRRQWSGNEKKVIKGIGIVTCVYVNPDTNQFWIMDYRLFDPDRDGKTKIDHLLDMWQTIVHVEQLPFCSGSAPIGQMRV